MLFQAAFTISALIAVALATPVDVIEKRSQQVQACGNNLNQMCCDSFQSANLFNFLPIQIGNNCNQVASSQKCQQSVACCQTGDQVGLVNIGAICPQINL